MCLRFVLSLSRALNEALSARLLAAFERIIPGCSVDSSRDLSSEYTHGMKVRRLTQVVQLRGRLRGLSMTHVGHASVHYTANTTQDGRIQLQVPVTVSKDSGVVVTKREVGDSNDTTSNHRRTTLSTYQLPMERVSSEYRTWSDDETRDTKQENLMNGQEECKGEGDGEERGTRTTIAIAATTTKTTTTTEEDRLRHRHAVLCSGYHAIGAICRGKTDQDYDRRDETHAIEIERFDRGFWADDIRFHGSGCFLDDIVMNLAAFHSPHRSTPSHKVLIQTDMHGFGAGSCLAFIPQNLGDKVQVAPACPQDVGGEEGGYQVFINFKDFNSQISEDWYDIVSSDGFHELVMAGVNVE